MTAVAPPVQFQAPSRTGWNSGAPQMSQDDMSRMFMPGPRKSAQRSNSSSSLNSASSSSTISAPSPQSQGSSSGADQGNWTTRKKGSRGIWPSGKAEPTAGLSTTRPQPVSTSSSGPSAASAISALHGPMLPSQQITNNQNGSMRGQPPSDVPALLHLSPMNGTFERKTINVPFYPDVLRIGRQTNAKTAPTPVNGFFDSKVLSRQHAEIYAERSGRVFIRDVKSSNGTFVNGQRLSPENKESDPHELREQDVLELGIDIVSEDQKTIVHHKVAARVEHAGIYTQGPDLSFGDLDPKRSPSQQSQQSAKANAMAAAAAGRDVSALQQPQWPRGWPAAISTENIVKRLNRELSLARQQSSDLSRSRACLEGLLVGESKNRDKGNKQEKGDRTSPLRQKSDYKPPTPFSEAPFLEPPAPPPQAPLPEKPDVAKALADPAIQPLLMRSETARPILAPNGSPTRADHSQALLILTQELKSAKDQIPSLVDRVKNLEEELKQERTARESAEERASQLETTAQKSPTEEEATVSEDVPVEKEEPIKDESPDLQQQLERLRAAMEDMKSQMEAYHRRAEIAESERDEARQSLAEMIEQKREENAELERKQNPSTPRSHSSSTASGSIKEPVINGHAPENVAENSLQSILAKAGMDSAKPLTTEQAVSLQTLLAQQMPLAQRGAPQATAEKNAKEQLTHHGLPLGSGFVVVVIGMALMHYLDGWEKLHSFFIAAHNSIEQLSNTREQFREAFLKMCEQAWKQHAPLPRPGSQP